MVILFSLLFIIVPLILTPFNYELFEYNKMMTTYALTAVIAVLWIGRMINDKKICLVKTPFDIPLLLFFLSQFISALFSIDPHISWFGYYSRFNGGMWSVIAYGLLFYSLINSGFKVIKIKKILKIMLWTGVVVAIYGVLERFGIDKHLWVQDVQNRVFSTLGQPNWLAAYLVALSPIAWAKFTGSKWRIADDGWKIKNNMNSFIWLSVSLLFFITLLFTRSRSGLLGFAVANIVFWGLLLIKSVYKKIALKQSLILYFCFILIIFFNGSNVSQIDKYFTFKSITDRITKLPTQIVPSNPQIAMQGNMMESGGTESGTIRKYVWQAAINAAKFSPKNLLIGTGTETFAWTFFRFRPVEHNLVSEWDFLYNKAHNEYLNYLATTGIFGLGSYLMLIFSVIIWILSLKSQNLKLKTNHSANSEQASKNLKVIKITDDESHKTNNDLPITGLFAGWVSILVTNFFGFSVVIVQILFFLMPALIFLLQLNHITLKFRIWKLNKYPDFMLTLVKYSIYILACLILIRLGLFWYADTLFAKGLRYNRTESYEISEPLLGRAVYLNPGEPLYKDEHANSLVNLGMAAAQTAGSTDNASQMIQQGLSENDLAIKISPANVNFLKTRTKLFFALAPLDEIKFTEMAIEALEKAHNLSPNDPKILYNLGVLYGRVGNTDKALEQMQESKNIKINYRDAYYGLYVILSELNKTDEAKDILREYLKIIPDKEFEAFINK